MVQLYSRNQPTHTHTAYQPGPRDKKSNTSRSRQLADLQDKCQQVNAADQLTNIYTVSDDGPEPGSVVTSASQQNKWEKLIMVDEREEKSTF